MPTPNGPKIFNANRSMTPIPTIPRRRLRALDRNSRGQIFRLWVTSGSPIFGQLVPIFLHKKKYGKLSYLYLFFRFFLPISIFIFQTRKIVHTSNFAVVFDVYVPPPGIIKKWRWNSRHSGSPCTPDSFFRFVSLVGSGGAPPLTSPLATEHTHTLLSDKAGWLWFFRCRQLCSSHWWVFCVL